MGIESSRQTLGGRGLRWLSQGAAMDVNLYPHVGFLSAGGCTYVFVFVVVANCSLNSWPYKPGRPLAALCTGHQSSRQEPPPHPARRLSWVHMDTGGPPAKFSETVLACPCLILGEGGAGGRGLRHLFRCQLGPTMPGASGHILPLSGLFPPLAPHCHTTWLCHCHTIQLKGFCPPGQGGLFLPN